MYITGWTLWNSRKVEELKIALTNNFIKKNNNTSNYQSAHIFPNGCPRNQGTVTYKIYEM